MGFDKIFDLTAGVYFIFHNIYERFNRIRIRNQAPTSFKTPPSPHRLFDLQDSHDKLMHFLPQMPDFVPLKNRFCRFRVHSGEHHPVDPGTNYTAVPRESPTDEGTQPVIRATGVSHTACKYEFRQNIRSHSWGVFSFL